jgi:hypothetical protein
MPSPLFSTQQMISVVNQPKSKLKSKLKKQNKNNNKKRLSSSLLAKREIDYGTTTDDDDDDDDNNSFIFNEIKNENYTNENINDTIDLQSTPNLFTTDDDSDNNNNNNNCKEKTKQQQIAKNIKPKDKRPQKFRKQTIMPPNSIDTNTIAKEKKLVTHHKNMLSTYTLNKIMKDNLDHISGNKMMTTMNDNNEKMVNKISETMHTVQREMAKKHTMLEHRLLELEADTKKKLSNIQELLEIIMNKISS